MTYPQYNRWLLVVAAFCFGLFITLPLVAQDASPLRVGIIGLDTSHAMAFTKEFHKDPASDPSLSGFRVVAAYPPGSPDIESSASRIPKYTAEMQELGVEIVDSITELLARVDCVLLETNDGRVHLDQALEVFPSGKPVFIDKPVGANLAQVIAIYQAAQHFNVPMFSSSSLRYTEGAQALRAGKAGKVLGCDAYSPCSLEPTHVDLFWYGIHGVETLFTCMNVGCESVSHTSTPDFELAVGKWSDGRIGSFRGLRGGKTGYGGTVFGEQSTEQIGSYGGYQPLVVQIAKFFRTRETPIEPAETIELYAFMEAAAKSKLAGGGPVLIKDVIAAATADAAVLLEGKLR
jgi:Oxidoreductase family, NAD-binding Rossmann fold